MSISLFRIVLAAMFLLAFGYSEMNAQTMFILNENGLLVSKNVSTIQKITFSESDIVLYKTDGKSELYSDTIIRYLNFENLKSIKSNAGLSLTVKEGDKVTLDGSASSGPFDDALMFYWTAPGGVVLSSTTISKPIFTTPEVTRDTTFVFKLYVSDGRNISEMDSVDVKVLNVNKMPSLVSPLTLNVAQNEYFEDTIVGLDLDHDLLTLNIENSPAFVTMSRISDNSYKISGTFPSNYYGKMEYVLSCSDGSSTVLYKINFDVSGVNPIPSEVKLNDYANSKNVFPSLVSDVVNIDNTNVHFRTFCLYNDQGQCLQTGPLSGGMNKVALEAGPSGLLFMRLQGDVEHLNVKLIKK
jgi:hypothetical protein